MAGPDITAALAAAIKDAPIPSFDSLFLTQGFLSSKEHLIRPTLAIAGNPRIGEEEAPRGRLCTRPGRPMDVVGVLAEMVAIILLLKA